MDENCLDALDVMVKFCINFKLPIPTRTYPIEDRGS